MSCIQPREMKIKTKYLGYKTIKIDCRHCMNCMIKRQSTIEFLAKKELLNNYLNGKSASFVTLTYDDDHLPVNEYGFNTLNRKDVQKFIKNMRRQMEYYHEKIDFKVIYNGEYGDGSHSSSKSGVSTCRPHYHLIFIGLSPEQIKKYTRKLWKFGLCDIGPLGAGGISYVCKYMTKALPTPDVKQFREKCKVQNPFLYHSVGLGKEWIDQNLEKIVQDGFTFNINNKIQLFPKPIIDYVAFHTNTNPKPYILDYYNKQVLPEIRASDKSFSEYDYEKSYIKEKLYVNSLRQQNKPVVDVTLSKSYAKPWHYHDRTPK